MRSLVEKRTAPLGERRRAPQRSSPAVRPSVTHPARAPPPPLPLDKMARERARSANPRAALAHARKSPRGAAPRRCEARIGDRSISRSLSSAAESAHPSFEGRKKSGTKWKPSENVSMTTVRHTAKFPDDLMTQEPCSGCHGNCQSSVRFVGRSESDRTCATRRRKQTNESCGYLQ